jgi:hypothetical protein
MRVADEEVGFGVAELVVFVGRMRRVDPRARTKAAVGTKVDARDAVRRLRVPCRAGRVALRLAKRLPRAFRLDPRAGDLGDHDGKIRGPQSHVARPLIEIDQIPFVFGDGVLGIAAVVPAVVPDESREFRLESAQARGSRRRRFARAVRTSSIMRR